jgi:hypothetical protein
MQKDGYKIIGDKFMKPKRMDIPLETTLDSKQLAKNLGIKIYIKNYKQWQFRMWLSTILIKLASKISWMNCEVILGEKNETQNS